VREHVDGPSFHLRDLPEGLKLADGPDYEFLGYPKLLLRLRVLREPLQVLTLEDVGDGSEQVNACHEAELVLAHVRRDVLFSLRRLREGNCQIAGMGSSGEV
jgi:hypothetical protein